jgi:hypothetical protein
MTAKPQDSELKELNELLESFRLPQAAGEDLALRNIALHLWGRFNSGGDWYRPLHFSQRELRHCRKTRAPMGVIADERSMVDFDPKRVAAVFDMTNMFSFGMAEQLLAGLPRVIEWLKDFKAALEEAMDDAEAE